MIFKTVAIICIGIVFLEIAVVVGIVLICVLDKDDEGMYDPKENVMCAQTGEACIYDNPYNKCWDCPCNQRKEGNK